MLLIASGDTYWRNSTPRLRRWLPLLWWVVAPASVRVCGYFAGTRLRIMADLPAGVMRQWARWARHRGYLEVDLFREQFASHWDIWVLPWLAT